MTNRMKPCKHCGRPVQWRNQAGYCQRTNACKRLYHKHTTGSIGYRPGRVYVASERYPDQIPESVSRKQVEMFKQALAPALERIKR